ncbi:MAG: hypothetical protein HYV07_01555 [Deltaproteobacteria bacterium]|nr:hypothetical protein [Deltaproteobacteria bacterium]
MNIRWLQAQREEYRGRSVALGDGELIDVDEDWDALDVRFGAAEARSSTLMASVDQLCPLDR